MAEHDTNNDLEVQVTANCHIFLKKAIEIAVGQFGSSSVPERVVHCRVMEPSGPGRHTGKESEHTELDVYEVWYQIRSAIHSQQVWENAEDAIQSYINARAVESTGPWPHDPEWQYLVPLFKTYLESTNAFVYNRRQAQKVINMMLRQLSSPEVEVLGFIILEGFEAEHPFQLESNLRVRPIEERELLMLGRDDALISFGPYDFSRWPHTDWWVCETRLSNPRGTSIGWNRIHDITDNIASALRMFKSGGVAIGFGTHQLTSPFGRMGRTRGGKLEQITVGQSRYVLSISEIPKFVKFWRKLRHLVERPQHYLHVPLRRMRAAGTRAQKEDALVDYVIGLEALLGTDEEQTELSYRFRVRGSVLLANKRSERKTHMKVLGNLYRLRSVIVHGGYVTMDELEEYLPLAESALRRIWNWYFKHYCSETDNKVGIGRIDADLVS